jgi:hypothetical protein
VGTFRVSTLRSGGSVGDSRVGREAWPRVGNAGRYTRSPQSLSGAADTTAALRRPSHGRPFSLFALGVFQVGRGGRVGPLQGRMAFACGLIFRLAVIPGNRVLRLRISAVRVRSMVAHGHPPPANRARQVPPKLATMCAGIRRAFQGSRPGCGGVSLHLVPTPTTSRAAWHHRVLS